jgi:hypothetical protein
MPVAAATPETDRMLTGEIAELNRSGDTKIRWNKNDPDEVEAARAAFTKLKRTHLISIKTADGNLVQVHKFDPAVERYVAVRPNEGG